MAQLFGTWRYGLAAAVLIFLAASLGLKIARVTQFDVHPHEIKHVEPFCYFQLHGWMLALNLDGLDMAVTVKAGSTAATSYIGSMAAPRP